MSVIALLPGDGIGREILDGPVALLAELRRHGYPIEVTGPWPYGTTGWVETGSILPESTMQACRDADVILSGAVGSHPGVAAADCPNPELALISLRHAFGLRISVRKVWFPDEQNTVIVRNITGGAYTPPELRIESDGVRAAEDRIILTPQHVLEILRMAADFADQTPGRRRVSADKANVFATSRLWRRCAEQVGDEIGIAFDHVNVDRAAYELVRGELPGVIATEGIFGDILSDLLCARAGSPAVCGSATINPDRMFGSGCTGLFEPAHGSSPHRTGTRMSNPAGAWMALADLFDWCPDLAPLGLGAEVRSALSAALTTLPPTYDRAVGAAAISTMDDFNAFVLRQLAALSDPAVR